MNNDDASKMNDPALQQMLEATRLANIRMHASRVKVPQPEGFEPQPVSGDPHEIFIYACPPFMLQLVGDGLVYAIQKGETFNDRMQKVIADMKQFITNQDSMTDPDKYFLSYKEITNPQGVQFKTFVQDMIFSQGEQKKFVRSAVAFFADNNPPHIGEPGSPVNPDFYQLVLSAGPFSYPSEQIKLGEINPEDKPTASLLQIFNNVLAGISIG